MANTETHNPTNAAVIVRSREFPTRQINNYLAGLLSEELDVCPHVWDTPAYRAWNLGRYVKGMPVGSHIVDTASIIDVQVPQYGPCIFDCGNGQPLVEAHILYDDQLNYRGFKFRFVSTEPVQMK